MSYDTEDLKQDAGIILLVVLSGVATMAIGLAGMVYVAAGYVVGRLIAYLVND